MFMHGGLAHIFGNMLFLWIFGDNVEHRIGGLLYAGFYIIAGIVASLAQILVNTDSTIPTLGASGAISGVLGAYIVMFPQNRVRVIIGRAATEVPALVAIGLWAVFQFLNGFGAAFASEETTGGVAYMAHIGGFIVGVLAGLVFRGIGGGDRQAINPFVESRVCRHRRRPGGPRLPRHRRWRPAGLSTRSLSRGSVGSPPSWPIHRCGGLPRPSATGGEKTNESRGFPVVLG
jgi:hypothetical protein